MTRYRHDGHDGICWECGAVVSPVAAVAHFGDEVLTAPPDQRIAMARNRDCSVAPRPYWVVAGELRDRGIDIRSSNRPPGCLPYRRDAREVVGDLAWLAGDVLAACSRALDRAITRGIRWATAPSPRRPAKRKVRRDG